MASYDDDTEVVGAFAVPAKGGIHRLGRWINCLGHGEVILKSDQEPSIIDLSKIVREEGIKAMDDIVTSVASVGGMDDKREPVSMVIENSPVDESKSNGAIEGSIRLQQTRMDQTRIARHHKEKHTSQLQFMAMADRVQCRLV